MPHSLIDEAARTGMVHGKSFVLRRADVWLAASVEEAPLASKRSMWVWFVRGGDGLPGYVLHLYLEG
eukprot:scaffold242045_cov68-Attheya_sp.AAC.1